MSALVTVEQYAVITGDSTSAATAVDAALSRATSTLEDDLQRGLIEGSRTEQLWPDSNGRLYPNATPLVSVADGYLIDGDTIMGSSPFPFATDFVTGVDYVTVTYVGGFVERTANPSAANRLPQSVETDLCWAAFGELHPSPLASIVPAGATSVRLGDAAVTYDKSGARAPGDQVQWSKRTLRLSRVGKRVAGPVRSFSTQGEV